VNQQTPANAGSETPKPSAISHVLLECAGDGCPSANLDGISQPVDAVAAGGS
jgi:hypothetical protein